MTISILLLSSCNSKDNSDMSGMKMKADSTEVNSAAFLDSLQIPDDKQKILSSLPAIHPVKKTINEKISADGIIEYDTRQERNIAARYSGRIEKLYVKYMYQPMKKGEVIMEIYSPDMVNEQQNLLFLLSDSSSDQQLISASERKLLLLGMTEQEIEQVIKTKMSLTRLSVYSPYEGHIHEAVASSAGSEAVQGDSFGEMNTSSTGELALKEGMYVEKGETLFNILDSHMVWAVLKIYSDDAAKIKLHQPATLIVNGAGKKIRGRIDFIEPFFQPNSKTLSARVYLDNPEHALKVGMYVRATIETDSVTGIWIPKEAMLDLGKRKIVFLKNTDKGSKAENVFEAHEITTGIASGDFIQVIKGLSEPDEIISNAQYIQDSESFTP